MTQLPDLSQFVRSFAIRSIHHNLTTSSAVVVAAAVVAAAAVVVAFIILSNQGILWIFQKILWDSLDISKDSLGFFEYFKG